MKVWHEDTLTEFTLCEDGVLVDGTPLLFESKIILFDHLWLGQAYYQYWVAGLWQRNGMKRPITDMGCPIYAPED